VATFVWIERREMVGVGRKEDGGRGRPFIAVLRGR